MSIHLSHCTQAILIVVLDPFRLSHMYSHTHVDKDKKYSSTLIYFLIY